MIDFHTHLGRAGRKRTDLLTVGELVRMMDARGIEKSVVLPLHDSPHGWYFSTTEDVLAAYQQFPARIIPFCQVDPRFGGNSPDTDFSDLLAEYRERGCRGMGEVIANMYFDDPMVVNLLRQCGDAGLPVVFHVASRIGGTYGLVDDAGLPRMEKALRELPDTIFCAHGPSWWSEMSADVTEETRGGYPRGAIAGPGAVWRLMATYPNLYGELSAGSGFNAITRDEKYGLEFLDRFQDKLLFGTDTLRWDMDLDRVKIVPFMKRILEEGKITPEAHRKITRENAVRLLKL